MRDKGKGTREREKGAKKRGKEHFSDRDKGLPLGREETVNKENGRKPLC